MKDILFTVQSNQPLYDGAYIIKLKSPEKLPKIRCGQFLQLETGRKDLILRRPFCVNAVSGRIITLVYAVVGKGTEQMALIKKGETVRAALPLGNGFCLKPEHKKVVLIGGGIGVAPLLMVPKTYPNREYFSFLGFPNVQEVILQEHFSKVSKCVVCTDDGSIGQKGNPAAALEEFLSENKVDVILTCGSTPMLKSVAALSAKTGTRAYMTGDSRMGCGVGACLVCACKIRSADGTIHNARACADGPIFDLAEVMEF